MRGARGRPRYLRRAVLPASPSDPCALGNADCDRVIRSQLSLGLVCTQASRDETDATVRGLHAELTAQVGPDATAEDAASARRCAAVEVAAALSAYFRLGIVSEHVTGERAAELARRF